jgi:hypothetical protein
MMRIYLMFWDLYYTTDSTDGSFHRLSETATATCKPNHDKYSPILTPAIPHEGRFFLLLAGGIVSLIIEEPDFAG